MKRFRLLFLFLVFQVFFCSIASAQKQFKVLLVAATNGWRHESVHAGVLAIQQLGVKNFFDVVYYENPRGINDKYLEQFQAIIFLCTTGDILDSAQQKAVEKFIESGKGFVGIHSASDTEYGWDWYTKMVGRMFKIHPAVQTAKLQVLDPKFPGLRDFDARQWTDEWYEFGPEKIPGLNYILAVDESTYDPKANWGAANKTDGMGKMHPLAWYHEYDGGRAFYTALGHLPTNFSDPAFLNHIYAGILYAATGKK